jgi:hypothetical protein
MEQGSTMQIDSRFPPYPDSNEESWDKVIEFIQEHPGKDYDYWRDYQNFLLPLLRAAIEAGYHHHFRAGGSMSDTVFSTVDRPLEVFTPKPPRVTLRVTPEKKYAAYSHASIQFFDPERTEPMIAQNAFSVLTRYLADLWRESKPSEPLPDCLEKALTSQPQREEE